MEQNVATQHMPPQNIFKFSSHHNDLKMLQPQYINFSVIFTYKHSTRTIQSDSFTYWNQIVGSIFL